MSLYHDHLDDIDSTDTCTACKKNFNYFRWKPQLYFVVKNAEEYFVIGV